MALSVLLQTHAQYITAVGQDAMKGSAMTTTGINGSRYRSPKFIFDNYRTNIAIGYQSDIQPPQVLKNTLIGYQAGYNNLTAGYNTLLGYQAGYNLLTDNNVAIGWQALYKIGDSAGGVYGENNVAIRFLSMAGGDDTDGNNTGYKNVAIGTSTLGGVTCSSDGDLTAYENVSIGYGSRKNVTTATRNVMIGYQAMIGHTAGGEGNNAIGYQALSVLQGVNTDYNTVIGQYAGSSMGNSNMYSTVLVGYGAGRKLRGNEASGQTALGTNALSF